MQINGSGGSFATKEYNINKALAWQLGLLVVQEMGIEITECNAQEYLLEGKIISDEKTMLFGNPIYKLVTFSVAQDEGQENVTVIVDIRKKQLEVYSFKPQNKETNHFFTLFDARVKEALSYKKCTSCGKLVTVGTKFCPECGCKVEG